MELSSRHIQDKEFATARRGYDRDEVDSFTTDCAAFVSALEERTRTAEVRAASSERELAAQTADIDVLLQEATDARRKIIDEARAEANDIANQAEEADGSPETVDATSKAAAIINEAEHAARMRTEGLEQLRMVAEQDAESIIRRAEQSAAMTQAEADRVLQKAKLDANSMQEEARATKASMDSQLAEIRRLLDATRAAEADTDLVVDLRERATQPQAHEASS